MTFSIVALDPVTGDLGVAVASKFLAVGSVVPWAQAGVGAIATQALANVRYGPDGLAALAGGHDAAAAVRQLTDADAGALERQAGIVDAHGGAATFTGEGCLPWAGGRTGLGWAVQGNILAGPEVVDAIVSSFVASAGALPDRLVDALLSGDRAGGDRRGRQSAALLVVRAGGGYGDGDDRWIDLRVDDHQDPVTELVRLLGIWRVLMERPDPANLIPIEPALATELRDRLTRAGWEAGHDDPFKTQLRAALGVVPRVGAPRASVPAWDEAWDGALLGWMGVANLEARGAALGWIDPAVLATLRSETGD